ncbi:hypothetical protein FHW37_11071 [Neorhizobium alkalisoli]|uniref:Uncharacterized protein n=1 Tax=Neorhizobium alkalisoli TaxID=528178 RepID=A0A561QBM7_9HYPH|nr:hypothetical protein FHW37_11071 [Neorhizobium alkalisoli]
MRRLNENISSGNAMLLGQMLDSEICCLVRFKYCADRGGAIVGHSFTHL